MMPELIDQGFTDMLRRVYHSGDLHIGSDPIFLGDEDRKGPVKHWVEYSYAAVRNERGDISEIVVEGVMMDAGPALKVLDRKRNGVTGVRAIDDAELLTAFLEFRDVRHAEELIEHFGSLRAVFAASADRLRQPPRPRLPAPRRLCKARVHRLKVASEIHRRILAERLANRPIISSSSKLHRYLIAELGDEPREQFRVLFLDCSRGLIADETMGAGTINHCAVYTREVIRRALELSAQFIILVHNHPSRSASFSQFDREITRDVAKGAAVLGLQVDDHLLVAGDFVLSLRSCGGW